MNSLMDLKLLLPLLFFGFILFRFFKFRKIKKELPQLLNNGATIIDVRTPAEFKSGSHPKSINIPLQNLEKELAKIDNTKPIVLCCASGARSAQAMSILKKNGLTNVTDAGPWTNTL